MQLKRIQELIAGYRQFLRTDRSHDNNYIWESQRVFQENWDLEAEDFRTVFDQSFQNSTTRRLWSRENHAPKQAMLNFIDMQPDYVQFMFRDLFNEDKEIGGRVDRFVFYCDELLREYKNLHPHSIENNHYHGDNYHMVSVYLAFRYPDRYTIYDQQSFVRILKAVGAKEVPRTNDFPRFVKVMRTLHNLLVKDEEVVEANRSRLDESLHYQDESMLLTYDFYHAFAQ